MAKFVLISDNTLVYDYRNFPLLDFVPGAPGNSLPKFIYSFLKGKISPALPDGRIKYAPYGLRKIEAALLKKYSSKDVVVAHPDYLSSFIKDDTEIIGMHTMDPLGLGPTTMSYYVLFKSKDLNAYVKQEWESLISKVNAARKGKKAKLVVGGPGIWEYTILRNYVEKHNIDYLFQGEMDDYAVELFEQISSGNIDQNMFSQGFITYDDQFMRSLKPDPKFIGRGKGIPSFPKLESIPLIVNPSTKSLNETMRGCGIGCDFCEVTLRELRYYPPEKVAEEVKVNIRSGGFNNAWLHSDEIFAYQHQKNYVPNEEALISLFTTIMSIDGVKRSNPTHGRISIPSAYPELIAKLSKILRASEHNWIGIQVGLETGSETLAKKHMPAKTLPLKIGVDGSWQEIVWNGVKNMNINYWRPAFTVQIGQTSETEEDNWETVALINRLSNSRVGHMPFEFTVTPLYNMPLGRIKSKSFDVPLTQSMLAVYYASYRHLAKMASRDAYTAMYDKNLALKVSVGSLISVGGTLMLKFVERIARKYGVDIEKAKTYGVGMHRNDIEAWSVAANA
ncbi:MAG: B12-binding domain-containing radical SAM protein [Candidatus Micrarchaeia archaeon]